MVAGAGHETGKMILEQRSGDVKSSSVEKKNNSVRAWDSGFSEVNKTSDVTSMSAFPSLLSIAGGRSTGRELLGRGSGVEAGGSPFTRSSGSSTDLSSSSFKSSLSGSAYGSSQDRESIGDRERGGQEKEGTTNQDGIVKPVKQQKEVKVSKGSEGKIMTEDPPDALIFATGSDAQQFGTSENGTTKGHPGKESENGVAKESHKDEKERGKQNAVGIDSARESESTPGSGKMSMSRASVGSDSNESSCSSIGYGASKPHKSNDKRYFLHAMQVLLIFLLGLSLLAFSGSCVHQRIF